MNVGKLYAVFLAQDNCTEWLSGLVNTFFVLLNQSSHSSLTFYQQSSSIHRTAHWGFFLIAQFSINSIYCHQVLSAVAIFMLLFSLDVGKNLHCYWHICLPFFQVGWICWLMLFISVSYLEALKSYNLLLCNIPVCFSFLAGLPRLHLLAEHVGCFLSEPDLLLYSILCKSMFSSPILYIFI